MMWWWHGYGPGTGFGPGFTGFNPIWAVIGALMGLLFLVAFLVLAFFVIRALARSGRQPGRAPGSYTAPARPANDGALAVLRERYARGEITREQYQEMRQELGAGGRPA